LHFFYWFLYLTFIFYEKFITNLILNIEIIVFYRTQDLTLVYLLLLRKAWRWPIWTQLMRTKIDRLFLYIRMMLRSWGFDINSLLSLTTHLLYLVLIILKMSILINFNLIIYLMKTFFIYILQIIDSTDRSLGYFTFRTSLFNFFIFINRY